MPTPTRVFRVISAPDKVLPADSAGLGAARYSAIIRYRSKERCDELIHQSDESFRRKLFEGFGALIELLGPGVRYHWRAPGPIVGGSLAILIIARGSTTIVVPAFSAGGYPLWAQV